MKPMSKATKAERYDAVSAEMWRNHHAMQALYMDTVTWSKWVSEPDSRESKYRIGVFGTTNAMGGYVITVFAHPGQGPQMNCYAWESFQDEVRKAQATGTIYGAMMGACVADVRDKLHTNTEANVRRQSL